MKPKVALITEGVRGIGQASGSPLITQLQATMKLINSPAFVLLSLSA